MYIFLNEINKSKYDKNIVSKIKKWRFKHSCKYCGLKLSKSIAVIKCNKSKCKKFLHVPSAINLNESDYKNDVFYLDFENIVKNIKLENEKNISEADSVKDFQMVDE